MPIIKWGWPFPTFGWSDEGGEDWRGIGEEIERLFEESLKPLRPLGRLKPAMDIYETKKDVVVEMPLAGVDPKDVEIRIEDKTLTVKGKFEKKVEVKEEQYYKKEIRTGTFARSVTLPTEVIKEKAEAVSEKGMLRITIPKAKPAKKEKGIKIKIKTK